jgi:DNA repair protein RecO (recombination protein O)
LAYLPVRGFILSTLAYGEADRICQVYTLQAGKVRAIAKGARKPKSKLSSSLELFTESTFGLNKRPGGDLYVLSQAKVLHDHHALKEDLGSISILQLLSDILIQSLHDHETNRELYALIKETLEVWKGSEAREQVLCAFCLRFLELSGYPLELTACAECQKPLDRVSVLLIPHRGGALCGDCCPSGPSALKATPLTLELLKKLRNLPMDRVKILKIKSVPLRSILLTLLEYLERTIEKKLRTLDYYLKVVPI